MIARVHFLPFVERTRGSPALPAAFVYPCDGASLQLALSSAFTSTLAPVLVGPEIRIRDVAAHAGLDIAQLPIQDTDDDPRASALSAADLARAGTVAALVKGSLGKEALLAPIATPDPGAQGRRRLSHAYFLDLPGQPRGILLADAEINVAPNLAAKRDILHNTIELAHALGVATPRVALLAARDAVRPALPATGDAAALRAMAEERPFGSAIVDGPLTVGSALSAAVALANGRESEVAGQADILIAPDLESAGLALGTLAVLTGGLAAGLVLGALAPVVAPAATDTMEMRIASCVLASLLAAHLAAARAREVSQPRPAAAAELVVTHAA